MKRYMFTIIAVVVLAVCVGAFLIINGVTGSTDDPSATEEPTTDDSYSKVFSISSSDIVKIESHYQNTYVLEYVTGDDGTSSWVCTNRDDVNVNSSSVSTIASSFASLQGYVITGFSDLDGYGFTDGTSTVYQIITLSDGTEYTLFVGDTDYTGKYTYVHIGGVNDTVYRIYYTYINDLEILKEDLVSLKAFGYSLDDTQDYLLIREYGEKILELSSTEEDSSGSAVWTVSYPLKRDASSSTVNELISAMRNIELNGIYEENAPDLSIYGLDVPDIEYYLRTTSEDGTNHTYILKIGGKTADAEYYYCLVDNSNDVYTVSESTVYKDLSAVNYMSSYVFLENYSELSEIEFTLGTETHKMKITFEDVTTTGTDGTETTTTVETRYFDGKEAPDDDEYEIAVSTNDFKPLTAEQQALNDNDDITDDIITGNPTDVWSHLLACLYSVARISNVELAEPAEKGEVLLSITYTLQSGKKTTLELCKRDNTTAYLYQDGNYAGGYCRTTYLTGDDYQNYDLKASIAALQAVLKLVP